MPEHPRQAPPEQPKQETPAHRNPSPETEAMYRLPNNPPLTEQDFKRYHTSNIIVDRFMSHDRAGKVRAALAHRDTEIREAGLNEIAHLPEDERITALNAAINDVLPIMRFTALEQITNIPADHRLPIIKLGMYDGIWQMRQLALSLVKHLPQHDIKQLILDTLETLDANNEWPKAILNNVSHLTDITDRADVLYRALALNKKYLHHQILVNVHAVDPTDAINIARTIAQKDGTEPFIDDIILQQTRYFPEQDRIDLIKQALESDNATAKSRAVHQFKSLPPKERAEMFDKALAGRYTEQAEALKQLEHYPDPERRADIIRKRLEDPNSERYGLSLWYQALEHLTLLPEQERIDFAERIMAGTEINKKNALLVRMESVPEPARSRMMLDAMRSPRVEVREQVLTQFELADAETRFELTKLAISDTHNTVSSMADELIKYLPEPQQIECLKLLIKRQRTLQDEAAEIAMLYADQLELPPLILEDIAWLKRIAGRTKLYTEHTHERFLTKEFNKTGSGTTLLDVVPTAPQGTFINRVIIRHIPAYAYETWRIAYEAADVWRKHGFDYVPIEPIVRAKPNARMPLHVDVYTRVIPGPNAEEWLDAVHVIHEDHITTSIKTILEVLEKMGIDHGHAHDRNFVLYFERDEKGEPDITKPPRVYLIDFDQAVSSSAPR